MFTHKDLIPIAYRWILKHASCGVAFKELVTLSQEVADVIGFGSGEYSCLIEVKASRSDFLCDKKKPFRINPDLGIGSRRFYLCPENLINISDLPIGWGLIWVNDKKVATCVYNPYNSFMQIPPSIERESRFAVFEKNKSSERAIMYSALRRLHMKGHIESIYTKSDAL